MPTYIELLKDPRWQRKRLEILQRDGWRCRKCGNEKGTLHVHHNYYSKGLNPWEYDDSTLRTLCEPCHKTAEEFRLAFANSVAGLLEEDEFFALGLVQGVVAKGYVRNGQSAVMRVVHPRQAQGMAQTFGCEQSEIDAAVDASPVDDVRFNAETGKPEPGY